MMFYILFYNQDGVFIRSFLSDEIFLNQTRVKNTFTIIKSIPVHIIQKQFTATTIWVLSEFSRDPPPHKPYITHRV